MLDEVHERDLDIDFVLLVIKIRSFRQLKTKIVLMSATIDCDLFINYFASHLDPLISMPPAASSSAGDETAAAAPKRLPLIKIPSKCFKVQDYYWDDLVGSNSFIMSKLTGTYKSKLERARSRRMTDAELLMQMPSLGHDNQMSKHFHPMEPERDYIDSNEQMIKKYRQHMRTLEFSEEQPEISEATLAMTLSLLLHFDDIEVQAIQQQQQQQQGQQGQQQQQQQQHPRIINGLAEQRGSVLIFVPGMYHILQVSEAIERELGSHARLDVLPLHSEIVLEQQQRVFERAGPSHRKVIIATSIAESSITVPDVKYVIDFGLTKELYCDPFTNYTHLRLEWASKSSMQQRLGRAGRVSDGTCYRLIPRQFYEDRDEYAKPPILREPLHNLVLNVKRLRQPGDPKRVLSLAIQPPKLVDIQRTVVMLKEVGALSLRCKTNGGGGGATNDGGSDLHDGDLTYVGQVMASLPIDVRFAKLILLGHVFGKLSEAITIAAGLSVKTFFKSYFRSYLEAFTSKWTYSDGWMCDVNIYISLFKYDLKKPTKYHTSLGHNFEMNFLPIYTCISVST